MDQPLPPSMPPPFILQQMQMQGYNQEFLPKETLYVTNLNDRIKPEDMKYALYFLFSQYGDLHKIHIKKSNKMRGQAFLIFHSVVGASNARANLNGMTIFDKTLKIDFAKSRSKIFEQMDGNIYAKPHEETVKPTRKELKELKKEAKLQQAQQQLEE